MAVTSPEEVASASQMQIDVPTNNFQKQARNTTARLKQNISDLGFKKRMGQKAFKTHQALKKENPEMECKFTEKEVVSG